MFLHQYFRYLTCWPLCRALYGPLHLQKNLQDFLNLDKVDRKPQSREVANRLWDIEVMIPWAGHWGCRVASAELWWLSALPQQFSMSRMASQRANHVDSSFPLRLVQCHSDTTSGRLYCSQRMKEKKRSSNKSSWLIQCCSHASFSSSIFQYFRYFAVNGILSGLEGQHEMPWIAFHHSVSWRLSP